MPGEAKPPDSFFEIFSFLIAVTLAVAVLIAASGGYRVPDDALNPQGADAVQFY